MRAELLDPFARGGDRRYRTAVHDLASDRAVDAPLERAGPDAVLVVDGIFLQRPELDGYFDLLVFLEAPFTATYARMSLRDGSPLDPDDIGNRRYREGQELYLATSVAGLRFPHPSRAFLRPHSCSSPAVEILARQAAKP